LVDVLRATEHKQAGETSELGRSGLAQLDVGSHAVLLARDDDRVLKHALELPVVAEDARVDKIGHRKKLGQIVLDRRTREDHAPLCAHLLETLRGLDV